MASNRKRKRAKSRANGKPEGAPKAGAAAVAAPATSKVHGKDPLTAEPLISQTAPPEPRPPTKKFRGQHPQRTQLPFPPAPLLLQHPVLSLYFPHLLPLHSFLQQALSFSSKPKIALRKFEEVVAGKGSDKDLASLLKTSVVGLEKLRVSDTILDIEDATQSTGGTRQSSTSTQSEVPTYCS